MDINLIIPIACTALGIIIMMFTLYKDGYKQGQIDAMHGKNEYVLAEFEDGTREYYKKSQLKDLKNYKLVS